MKTTGFFVALLLMSTTCRPTEGSGPPPDLQIELVGDWLLYEQGYSPGGGYITEEVAASPPQKMTFGATGEFGSTIQGLEAYKGYQLKITPEDTVVYLYERNPEDKQHSYFLAFESGNLMLHYRFCTEGCHLALRPLQVSE